MPTELTRCGGRKLPLSISAPAICAPFNCSSVTPRSKAPFAIQASMWMTRSPYPSKLRSEQSRRVERNGQGKLRPVRRSSTVRNAHHSGRFGVEPESSESRQKQSLEPAGVRLTFANNGPSPVDSGGKAISNPKVIQLKVASPKIIKICQKCKTL